MLNHKAGFDLNQTVHELGSKNPRRMIDALEQVNGQAATPDIFDALLPAVSDAITVDLADINFYNSAEAFLSNFPDKSARSLMSKFTDPEGEKVLASLLQLDLLIAGSLSNKEGPTLSIALQSELISELEKLRTRHDNNISIAAENLIQALRPAA